MRLLSLIGILILHSMHCQGKILYKSTSAIVPTAGNGIAIITIPDEFHLRVDVTFNTVPRDNVWRNILDVTGGYYGDLYTYNSYFWVGFTAGGEASAILQEDIIEANKLYHIDLRVTQDSMILAINGVHKQSDMYYGSHHSGYSQDVYASKASYPAADCTISYIEIRDDIEESLQYDYIFATEWGFAEAACLDYTWTPVYCLGSSSGGYEWAYFVDSDGYTRLKCEDHTDALSGIGVVSVSMICIKIAGTNSPAILNTDSGIPGKLPFFDRPAKPTKNIDAYRYYNQYKFEVFVFVCFPIICYVFWRKKNQNKQHFPIDTYCTE